MNTEMNTNIQPADRIQSVSEYYFSHKLRQIAEMNTRGENVISLGIGSPDLPPSEATTRQLSETASRSDSHGYQTYTGIPELRQAFATFYQRMYGVSLDADGEILPLMGSKEGILYISMAFLNVGDKVLVPNPGYPTYTSVSRLLGAEILTYDLDENNGWQPDFEALEKSNLDGVKLMWVNYPNMPTGAKATPELFRKLVDFGKRKGIVIVHDNPYSLILNREPLSILSTEGAKDICIELNSMSKSHNMPGWRIGMLATNSTFAGWVLKVLSNVQSGMFKAMQTAAVEALANSNEWHKQNNIELYARRRSYAESIMKVLGCAFDPSQAGMFLWGKIPTDCPSGEYLADRVLHEAKVFITPGFIFGSGGDRYVRISLCASEAKLKEALERIERLLSK